MTAAAHEATVAITGVNKSDARDVFSTNGGCQDMLVWLIGTWHAPNSLFADVLCSSSLRTPACRNHAQRLRRRRAGR